MTAEPGGWLDPNGPIYLFTSGPGGFLEGIGGFAVFAIVLHHLNCHESGCWRPARHAMGGYCRRHRRG